MYNQTLEKAAYYAESWQKGARQVQERKLLIRLSREVRVYETTISDTSGEARYKLRVEPVLTDRETSDPVAWKVNLIGPDDTYSLLQPDNNEHKHHFSSDDYLALLYPVEDPNWRKTGFMGVPLSSKRVIKVEGFYCIIQAKAYELSHTNSRAFASLEVEIEFTNTYNAAPRKL